MENVHIEIDFLQINFLLHWKVMKLRQLMIAKKQLYFYLFIIM